ncbi:DUF481 domain-containing protein [Boseongicola sp. H5]|uniref:DUF481 domain-containing protein n=1 Tax=Boseongicola sp. H5 TaxID=2763261 RepID=UPI001D0ACC2E|nr:DUF481 domain-containing protein [Boseongicola sp. H5]
MTLFAKPLLLAAMMTGVIVSAAAAQTNIFSGTETVDDQIEDLRDDIDDDFDRDIDRFGNEGQPLGFSGSLALRGTASDGNTDTANLGIGTSLGYYDGTNGYTLALSYAFGEENNVTSEESLLYDLEYRRDLNPALFGFATVQGSVDQFSSFESDTFIGAGLGYRISNTNDFQWSVQAGPGYRIAELSNLTSVDEAAFSIGSNLLRRLNENVFFTSDIDVVISDFDTAVFSDLGLTVAMTDMLALRTSIQTEYHTDPLPGFSDTDQTFGVSLVYTFN